MTELSINAEYVRLAQGFCSTEDLRYYLKGVQVEPHPSGKGVLIIATSGLVAGIFYDRTGIADRNYLLELDNPTIAALKIGRGEKKNRILTIKNDRLTVTHQKGHELHIKPNAIEIDGTYPDWRRIIPSEFETYQSAPTIDTLLLKPFTAACKSLCDKSGVVMLTSSPDRGPISCRIHHADFMGVIMQMRDDVEGATVDWL